MSVPSTGRSHVTFADGGPPGSVDSDESSNDAATQQSATLLSHRDGKRITHIDSSSTHVAFGGGIDPQDEDEASSDEEDWGHRGPHHVPHHLRRGSQSQSREHAALLDGHAHASDGGGDGGDPHDHGDHHQRGATGSKSMLFVFSVCNLLTYFDRGSMSVCLDNIMKPSPDGYDLTNFEVGVLAGAYMFGYITASPIFAMMVRRYDPFKLIAFGLSIWALAAIGCAASIGFVSILMARAFSGVGEAAFLCIAPPFVDKCAPSEAKSRWMAIFSCAIPIGYALGFVVSGNWLNFYVVPVYYQWRFIFLFEGILMIPFVLWYLATESPPHNFKDPPPSQQHRLDELNEPVSYRGPRPNRNQNGVPTTTPSNTTTTTEEETPGVSFAEYMETVYEVLSNKVYMLIIAGYAAQTFVLGSVAYFAVRYLMENFHFSVGEAGSYFGGITVVVGVVGSFFGGWLCDYYRRGKNKAHATAVTMKLAAIIISSAFPLCMLSFAKNTAAWFFSFFVGAEFLLFATASPINSAVIWSVPFRLSPLACSLSIMFIHILGDAISPAIVGAILDATKNWTLTMTINTLWLIWSVIFWVWAWRAAEEKARAIDEEMRARGMPVDGADFISPDLAPIDHQTIDVQQPPPIEEIKAAETNTSTNTDNDDTNQIESNEQEDDAEASLISKPKSL